MLQLPLMMVIITWLKCNTGLTLRLLYNPSCCPTKVYVEAGQQMHIASQKLSQEWAGNLREWWGLILKPYKDGIRVQVYTARKKIESLEGNMWLIPFCHQWILKVFSRSVKIFVNHNGGTVKISSVFQGQEVSREFKWGIVSYHSLIRPQGF